MKNRIIPQTLRCESTTKHSVRYSADGIILLMLNQVRLWSHRVKTRRVLANLSHELIKDIGLSKEQVKAEINQHFWK